MGGLNLEGVAVGTDGGEVEGLEDLAAVALEAAGGVGEGHARDEADVESGAGGENQAVHGPVDDADAADVARAEHEIGAEGAAAEGGDGLGVVGEVGVHLHHETVAGVFEGPGEAGDVGAAEALLLGAVEDVDAWGGGGQTVGGLAGAVGGAIVDEEDVGLGAGVRVGAGDGLDVLDFVIGGDDD